MRTRARGRASLAGWLFADLSIVLAIVFIGSSITTSDAEVRIDQSSTTTLNAPEGNSLDVSPIVVTVTISDPRNPIEVQTRLADALLAQHQIGPSAKFGVVIIDGPTGGPLNSVTKQVGKVRSRLAAESLSSWPGLTMRRWVSGNRARETVSNSEYQFTLLEDLTTSGD